MGAQLKGIGAAVALLAVGFVLAWLSMSYQCSEVSCGPLLSAPLVLLAVVAIAGPGTGPPQEPAKGAFMGPHTKFHLA